MYVLIDTVLFYMIVESDTTCTGQGKPVIMIIRYIHCFYVR